jgi:hypothetical protein
VRFLADESCDFAAVRALRVASHDVLTVAEAAPSAEDEVVVGLALREQRGRARISGGISEAER